MSRITGTDAFNMMEAYNAVYAPQEITEEQVWEEVEAWVNSLVEEGYDLSEFTWEEMYEEYLNEYAAGGVSGSGGATRMYSRPVANTGSSYQSRFARPMNAGTPQTFGGGRSQVRTVRPQIGGLPANYRGQELQQTATARASQVGTTRQGTAGGPTTGGNTPIGPSPTRPAATPARPAAAPAAPSRPAAAPAAPARPAAAPARPAAAPAGGTAKPTTTATTTAPATAPATTPAAPARTFNPLMQRTFGYQTGYAPSQIKQDPKKMAVMGSLRNSFDPFDIVQGYLIDEGYAETEEAAAVIMANMSEEWKESILESGYFPTKESQMKDEAKYNLRGQTVNPRTVQTQAKPTPSNLK